MALRRTFLVIVSVALICGVAATASAFSEEAIYDMLENAYQFCPPALKTYLQQNQQYVRWGAGIATRWERVRLDPWELETIYRQLVANLKSGKAGEFQTAKRFGVLACFVAETILPGPVYINRLDYEPVKVVYEGYAQRPDLKSRIAYLMVQYRAKHAWDNNPESLRPLYQKAVNEIVDLWVSAWKEAGLDISGAAERGATVATR